MPPFCRSRCVQPRTRRVGEVPELRELDLELAFEAAGALREDVENEAVAVEHAPPDQFLEIALLAGRERVIEEHDVRATRDRCVTNLLCLAGADEQPRIRPRAAVPERSPRVARRRRSPVR